MKQSTAMILDFEDEDFLVEVETIKTGEDEITSIWVLYDTDLEKIMELNGTYTMNQASNPFYIEDVIDSIISIIKTRIFLYRYNFESEHDLIESNDACIMRKYMEYVSL